MQDSLEQLTRLSREFGGERYVVGGGGNTSFKDDDHLWVKPSGGTLRQLSAVDFVCVSRKAIADLFATALPTEARAREAAVKDWMARAVVPGSRGRPSVEAPLHSLLPGRFVVHTHPALLNGLACAMEGAAACARLLPEALWVAYVDPGYTLCAHARKELEACTRARGAAPTWVVLQNHGIFISGDSPEVIRHAYATVLERLEAAYRLATVGTTLSVGPLLAGAGERARAALRVALAGEPELAVAVSGSFPVFRGPLSPDHVVYAGAFACRGGFDRGRLQAFRAAHGYLPRVVDAGDAVLGLGTTAAAATLALTFARDAALVEQLAAAFGGPRYMDDRARRFIEHWEVEQYRRQVVTGAEG